MACCGGSGGSNVGEINSILQTGGLDYGSSESSGVSSLTCEICVRCILFWAFLAVIALLLVKRR